MYLKDYMVNIPYETKKIVIRDEKLVLMEMDRQYFRETQDSRVRRKAIGKVVPLFPGKMYPNENYFALVPNDVPAEIRDGFLRRCARRRELEKLRKNPEAMMQRVSAGIQFLKDEGRRVSMEIEEKRERRECQDAAVGLCGSGDERDGNNGTACLCDSESGDDENNAVRNAATADVGLCDSGLEGDGNDEEGKFWFITNEHDLEYVMKVFGDLYSLMDTYTLRNPKDVLDGYKAKMFNKILEELKLTMPDHRILQQLELIREPEDGEDGMTYSDVLMLLTWYKNCLTE